MLKQRLIQMMVALALLAAVLSGSTFLAEQVGQADTPQAIACGGHSGGGC
jgi:hypothetical protein